MDIDGLGEKIVEVLFNENLVREIYEFYTLKDHEEELMMLDGIGKKTCESLFKEIEESKKNDLYMVICALAIPNVGKKTAIVLANHFETLDRLALASVEELSALQDVGEITANGIVQYFEDEHNKLVIEKLRGFGVNFKILNPVVQAKDNFFKGQKFVLTGALSVSRDVMTKRIEALGAISSGSVSKATNFVLAGEDAGSKLEKAKKLGIKIYTEDEIIPLLEEAESVQ